MIIHTWGYSKRTLEELHALRDRLGAVIVDTRLVPVNRFGVFGRKRLEQAFGADYIWIREFGNVNYKTDGPMKLADPAGGFEKLRACVQPQRPLLLICACASASTCHRSDAAAFISVATGWPVEHLP